MSQLAVFLPAPRSVLSSTLPTGSAACVASARAVATTAAFGGVGGAFSAWAAAAWEACPADSLQPLFIKMKAALTSTAVQRQTIRERLDALMAAFSQMR